METEPDEDSPVYENPLVISRTTELRFRSIDQVGNLGVEQNRQYIVDKVPPVVSHEPNAGSYNEPIFASLLCLDEPGVGCDVVHYTLDGSEPTQESPVLTEGLPAIDESVTIRYFAMDLAGNSSDLHEVEFELDFSAPSIEITPIPNIYNEPVEIDIQCTDSTEDICASIFYTLDGSDPTQESMVFDISTDQLIFEKNNRIKAICN